MSDQSQSLATVRTAVLSASERASVLQVARTAISTVDPRELVPFDLAGESVLAVRRPLRCDPAGAGSHEIMDSLTDGAVAAAAGLVQLALAGVAVRTWQWFAARLAARRAPVEAGAGSAVQVGGADADLIRELDRILRVAFDATAPFLSDEEERWRVARAVLAAYVQLRLAAIESPSS